MTCSVHAHGVVHIKASHSQFTGVVSSRFEASVVCHRLKVNRVEEGVRCGVVWCEVGNDGLKHSSLTEMGTDHTTYIWLNTVVVERVFKHTYIIITMRIYKLERKGDQRECNICTSVVEMYNCISRNQSPTLYLERGHRSYVDS